MTKKEKIDFFNKRYANPKSWDYDPNLCVEDIFPELIPKWQRDKDREHEEAVAFYNDEL